MGERGFLGWLIDCSFQIVWERDDQRIFVASGKKVFWLKVELRANIFLHPLGRKQKVNMAGVFVSYIALY